MNFSQLQRLFVFSMSFLFLSTNVGYSQSEKFLSEIRKEEAKADASSDQDAIGKLDNHPNAKNVHYFKMGNIANVHKKGLFDFTSPITGKSIHAMTTRIEYQSDKDYYWYGTVSDSIIQGDMMLICKKGEIYGHLKYRDEGYRIYGIGNSISGFVPDLKLQSQMCPEPIKEPKKGFVQPPVVNKVEAILTTCPVENRVLILYTAAAQAHDPDILQTASVCVEQFNQALRNSGITTPEAYISLADVQQLNSFTGATVRGNYNSVMESDLYSLQANNEAQGLRNINNADMVVLLTDGNYIRTSHAIGLAFFEPDYSFPFAIVEDRFSDSPTYYTFTHEVGHIFGGAHEAHPGFGYNGNILAPYARGFYFEHRCFFCFTTNRYVTTMHDGVDDYGIALESTKKILQFSSPLLTYEGVPAGDVSNGDVARRIVERAYTIASFNPAVVGQLTASISGVQSINYPGYYTFSSNVECGLSPYSYHWDVSSDGYSYFNDASMSSSVSVGVYPGSSYGQSGHVYLRLRVKSDDQQWFTAYYSVYVNNVHYIKLDNSGITDNKIANASISNAFPNPTENSTIFEFILQNKQNITIELLNEFGQKIRLLESGEYETGTYQHTLNTESLSSGIYFYRLTSENFSDTKRLLISK